MDDLIQSEVIKCTVCMWDMTISLDRLSSEVPLRSFKAMNPVPEAYFLSLFFDADALKSKDPDVVRIFGKGSLPYTQQAK